VVQGLPGGAPPGDAQRDQGRQEGGCFCKPLNTVIVITLHDL
jgi:hypothetical protein